MNSREEQWQVSAELRESINGNKPRQVDAHQHTGLAGDEKVRRLLNHLATFYEPELAANQYDDLEAGDMPATVENTELFQKLIRNEATETLTRSIHNNDPVTQSAAIGDPGTKSDISGLSAINDLREIVGRAAPIIYIFGEPGSGKTNFSLLLSQLWRREQEGEARLISNIRTWQEADEWVPTYGRLQEILDNQTRELEEGGITQTDDAVPHLFIFDEASSHASGRGKQGHETNKKLAPMLYKIRKCNAGIIIIGHDGKDVAPAIRELATVVERYRGKMKKATVWNTVNNREGEGKIMELDGIPETDFSYDDKEATSWDWTAHSGIEEKEQAQIDEKASERADELVDNKMLQVAADMAENDNLAKDEKVELAVHLYQSDDMDASQKAVADAVGISQQAISYKINYADSPKADND